MRFNPRTPDELRERILDMRIHGIEPQAFKREQYTYQQDYTKSCWTEVPWQDVASCSLSCFSPIADWCEVSPWSFVQVPYTGCGDYCGSLVERSNLQACQEAWAGIPGVIEAWGDYSHTCLYVRAGLLLKPTVWEIIASLFDYPCVDEELHSSLEWEATQEAWDSWGFSDWKKALQVHFDSQFRDHFGEDSWEDDWTDKLDSLACLKLTFSDGSGDWINEQGTDMYLDMERSVLDLNWETQILPLLPQFQPQFQPYSGMTVSGNTFQQELPL